MSLMRVVALDVRTPTMERMRSSASRADDSGPLMVISTTGSSGASASSSSESTGVVWPLVGGAEGTSSRLGMLILQPVESVICFSVAPEVRRK